MKICGDKHDEVCYESKRCPVCVALEVIDLGNAEMDVLKHTIDAAELEIVQLQRELQDHEN